MSIRLFVNGFLGYVLGVFAAAGAGNSGYTNYFMSTLLPIWVGIFVMVVIFSYMLAITGRHRIAMNIPLLTIPLMFSALFLTAG